MFWPHRSKVTSVRFRSQWKDTDFVPACFVLEFLLCFRSKGGKWPRAENQWSWVCPESSSLGLMSPRHFFLYYITPRRKKKAPSQDGACFLIKALEIGLGRLIVAKVLCKVHAQVVGQIQNFHIDSVTSILILSRFIQFTWHH